MNRVFQIFFSVLLIGAFAKADDVYLRSGFSYKNVLVDSTGAGLLITMRSHVDTVAHSMVLRHDKSLVDPDRDAVYAPLSVTESKYFINASSRITASGSILPVPLKIVTPVLDARMSREEHPHSIFLIASVLTAWVACDQLSMVKKYNAAMDRGRDPMAEQRRSAAYVVGGLATAACVGFTIYAAIPVTVYYSDNKLNLACRF